MKIGTVTEKSVYKLIGMDRKVGFEVTVSDEDGVEIDTNQGMGIEEFVSSMKSLIGILEARYEL